MSPRLRSVLATIAIAMTFSTLLAVAELDRLRELAFSDTDDAMRVVQASDLLDGQSWWDLTQYRLDPPGTDMHWSRHLDALVAPVMAAVPGDTGVLAAALTTPAVLLLGVLSVLLVSFSASEARSDRWVLVIASLTSIGVLTQYVPGRLDHHGLQALLALAAAVALIAGRPAVAGVLLGGALPVGLDTLPVVVGVLGAIGLGWVVRPAWFHVHLRTFAPALLASAAVGTLVFTNPSRLWSLACDVFSLPLVAGLGVVAVSLPAVAGRGRTGGARFGLLSAAGLGALAAFAAVGPDCLAGPYAAVPRELSDAWLANVSEVQPLLSRIGPNTGFAVAVLVVVASAGALTIQRILRGDGASWVPYFGALLGAAVVPFVQVRGASLVSIVALPTLALLASAVRRRTWSAGRAVEGVVLVVALVTATGMLPVVVGAAFDGGGEVGAGAGGSCRALSLYEGLAAEPDGLVLAHLDLGPFILMNTDHSVLAGPYHRNVDGNLQAFELFAASDGADLVAAGVGLVAHCPDTSVNRVYVGPEGTLMQQLEAGETPPYLELIDDGVLRVYRVVS